MNRILFFALILGLSIGILLPGEALAAREAKIIFMQGDVQVQRGGSGAWTDAEKGLVLSAGDKIKTGKGSWVEVGMGKGYENVIKLDEETLTEISNLGPVQISLLSGELRTLLENLDPEETFEVMTPTAVCGARGTGWDTMTDGVESIVDVYEDSIFFGKRAADGSIMADPVIKAGKRGVMKDLARPINIRNVPMNRVRDYKKWKKDFTQRRAVETGKSESGGGGVSGDDEGTLDDKVDATAKQVKSLQDLQKGKENISDRLDEKDIENRLKDDDPCGCP